MSVKPTSPPAIHLHLLDLLRDQITAAGRTAEMAHALSPELGDEVDEVIDEMAGLEVAAASMDPLQIADIVRMTEGLNRLAIRMTALSEKVIKEFYVTVRPI